MSRGSTSMPKREEAPSRRRASRRFPSLLSLLTFSGWNVNPNVGFLISQSSSSPILPCRNLHNPQNVLLPSCQWTLLRASTLSESWLPVDLIPIDSTIDDKKAWRAVMESKALDLAADLIRDQLNGKEGERSENSTPSSLVLGKFVDLCCTLEGERKLERLFEQNRVEGIEETVILGAVACLHSVLVMGMTYGLSGTPEQFDRWTAHLKEPEDDDRSRHDFTSWNVDSTRRLKYQGDRTAAVKLLAQIMRKQTPQGAFELLVSLGVWNKHEDLVLLRSGFPIRFSDAEMKAAGELMNQNNQGIHDPDSLLGIRKDMRSMKVVTIDSASTSEIDDGVACEEYTSDDGSIKRRYWIHIADADRIAKRDSLSFLGARRRATSHYLPEMAIPMFPSSLSDAMSLTAQTDTFALSLGVELADDGSIVPSSIIVTPSIVNVNYRLTYQDVDEMLADGVAYREEWELGALFDAATQRRKYRIRNGSSEGFVPKQIPQYTISAFRDHRHPDGIGISISVDVSHNGGTNQSAVVEDTDHEPPEYETPVSSASVLVTEIMILAGEAIGKWKLRNDEEARNGVHPGNSLRLAFRSQPAPDYRSRGREQRIMEDLLVNNIGDGYCHAWYARRFLSPVSVSDLPKPHSGLGLDCYCQWTSPIRRISDLQVHCAIKRYLRRQAVLQVQEQGGIVAPEITPLDLGMDMDVGGREGSDLKEMFVEASGASDKSWFDLDIDYSDRASWSQAARTLQKHSQQYWMLEYIRRLKAEDPDREYDVVVLGCTNPSRLQYALYIYELGMEWRYVSPSTSLQAGMRFKVQVGNVLPRLAQLSLVRTGL